MLHGQLGLLDGLSPLARDEDVLREVSRAIQTERWLLLEMKRETLGLEEIFLALVGRAPDKGPGAFSDRR